MTMTKEEKIAARELKQSEAKDRSKKRQAEKELAEKLEALENQMNEVTLKIMNFDMIKGSPEHLVLREELHRLNDIKKEMLGSDGSVMRKVNRDDKDLQDAMRENRAKKLAKLKAKMR